MGSIWQNCTTVDGVAGIWVKTLTRLQEQEEELENHYQALAEATQVNNKKECAIKRG